MTIQLFPLSQCVTLCGPCSPVLKCDVIYGGLGTSSSRNGNELPHRPIFVPEEQLLSDIITKFYNLLFVLSLL